MVFFGLLLQGLHLQLFERDLPAQSLQRAQASYEPSKLQNTALAHEVKRGSGKSRVPAVVIVIIVVIIVLPIVVVVVVAAALGMGCSQINAF